MATVAFLAMFCWLAIDRIITAELSEYNWDPQNENIALLPPELSWRDRITDKERRALNEIIRDTEDGDIRGLSVPGVHDTSSFVNMFLGIPYARPPVGQWRFKVGHLMIDMTMKLIVILIVILNKVVKNDVFLQCKMCISELLYIYYS